MHSPLVALLPRRMHLFSSSLKKSGYFINLIVSGYAQTIPSFALRPPMIGNTMQSTAIAINRGIPMKIKVSSAEITPAIVTVIIQFVMFFPCWSISWLESFFICHIRIGIISPANGRIIPKNCEKCINIP